MMDSCYQRSQEQSLKANHNLVTPVIIKACSCYQRSQEQSLKANHNYQLANLINSSCYQRSLKQSLKANHNCIHCLCKCRRCCYQRSLKQSLKANHNSAADLKPHVYQLLSKISETKFESKSQPWHGTGMHL